jgi:hypothetical protein
MTRTTITTTLTLENVKHPSTSWSWFKLQMRKHQSRDITQFRHFHSDSFSHIHNYSYRHRQWVSSQHFYTTFVFYFLCCVRSIKNSTFSWVSWKLLVLRIPVQRVWVSRKGKNRKWNIDRLGQLNKPTFNPPMHAVVKSSTNEIIIPIFLLIIHILSRYVSQRKSYFHVWFRFSSSEINCA